MLLKGKEEGKNRREKVSYFCYNTRDKHKVDLYIYTHYIYSIDLFYWEKDAFDFG